MAVDRKNDVKNKVSLFNCACFIYSIVRITDRAALSCCLDRDPNKY